MDSTLSPAAARVGFKYVSMALDEMLEVAERVGEHLDERPLGPTTNAVGALVFHCTEVCEFWVGHVALGRPSDRDRDAEFSTALPLHDLRARVEATRAQLEVDLDAMTRDESRPPDPRRDEIRDALVDPSDESIVMHLVEELFQHVGQMELTADVFRSRDG
jgi:uncharacterized damage-inducible protein DinB